MSTTSTARNLVNGVWSDTGSVHQSICPSTSKVIGAYDRRRLHHRGQDARPDRADQRVVRRSRRPHDAAS